MKKRISGLLRGIAGLALLGAVAFIMVNHLGLIDSLDFGAGAYYYADIPGFAALMENNAFVSQTPMWALTLLFLLWGAVMYRRCVWLDKNWT